MEREWTQDEIDDDQFRYEDRDDCDHEQYEIDLDGSATCTYCMETWWPSSESTASYWEAHRRACEPPTLWERVTDFIAEIRSRYRTWKFNRTIKNVQASDDDDVPF